MFCTLYIHGSQTMKPNDFDPLALPLAVTEGRCQGADTEHTKLRW